MKKLLAIILSLTTILCLASCGKKQEEDWKAFLNEYEQILAGISDIMEKYPEAADIEDLPEDIQDDAAELLKKLDEYDIKVDEYNEILKDDKEALSDFAYAYFEILRKYDHVKH